MLLTLILKLVLFSFAECTCTMVDGENSRVSLVEGRKPQI